jgi:hypothetical protein
MVSNILFCEIVQDDRELPQLWQYDLFLLMSKNSFCPAYQLVGRWTAGG